MLLKQRKVCGNLVSQYLTLPFVILRKGASTINHQVILPGKYKRTDISTVPKEIVRPDYSLVTLLKFKGYEFVTESDEEERVSEACQLAAHVLKLAGENIEPGITTEDIDHIVHEEIILLGAYPSPLGYRNFPKSCSTAVNNVLCHGIPDDRRLESGDIVNIDISVFYRGYHGDTSDTFEVGQVDAPGQFLIKSTRESLQRAIAVCRHGEKMSIIGATIEDFAEECGFTVSRRFVGHGIGRYFHTLPNVLHYRSKSNAIVEERMIKGMLFTIEPILMEGSGNSHTLDDGWTEVSDDQLRSAQAEHTLLITNDGCKVLT